MLDDPFVGFVLWKMSETGMMKKKKRRKSHARRICFAGFMLGLSSYCELRRTARDGYGGKREISYRVNISQNENAGVKSISEAGTGLRERERDERRG